MTLDPISEPIRIGVVGGSGLYDIEKLVDRKEVVLTTPFGKPSAPYLVGTLDGQRVAFLARHGAGHNKRVKLVRAAPLFYVARWSAIFPGTFKVDSSEMSPCTLNSGGSAPGRFPAASTPTAGNNMRQWDQGALRNAQERGCGLPAVVHHLVR